MGLVYSTYFSELEDVSEPTSPVNTSGRGADNHQSQAILMQLMHYD